ncbi:MAG: preprotein translocase subunit SecD, partial [Longimicrobiales bacterium]
MFGTLRGRLLIIAAVVIASAVILYTRGINLGLDLSGGIYLALEVQDPEGTMSPEVRRDHTERNLHILRNRIDPVGTGEQNVQRIGDYRIIVELPGETDIERARQLISQTAFLEFRLVRDLEPLISALQRMDRAVIAALGPDAADATDAARDTARGMQQDVRERLFGRQDTAAADTAAADTAAAAPASSPLSPLLLAGGDGEMQVMEQDVERAKRYLALPGVAGLVPRGTELVWDAEQRAVGAQLYRSLYLLDTESFITGERLENATAARDPQFNQTIVQFQFDRRGGRTFSEVTSRNIDNRIAIVLDGEVHSA